MIGRNGVDFLHPDDLEHAREEMRAARGEHQTRDVDSRFIHKDGRTVWLSWIGAWSEPVQRHFFVGRDMTESRLAQETLRESEQLARNIVETALDAFVQIDENGSILKLELAGRKDLRMAAQGGAGQGSDRPDRGGAMITSELKAGARALPRVRAGPDPRTPPRAHGPAARRQGVQGRAQRDRAEDAATASCSTDSSATSPTRSRRRSGSGSPRRWKRSASSPAASRTISTTSSPSSPERSRSWPDAVAKEPQLAAITKMIDEAAGARRRPDPASACLRAQAAAAAARDRRQHADHRHRQAVAADARRADRDRIGVRGRDLLRDRRSQPAHHRDPQPGAQRARRDARRRQADPGDRRPPISTRSMPSMHDDVQPGHYALIAVSDTGNGIPAAIARQGVQPVLHLEGPGQGHRARPEHGLRLHQAVRRPHQDLQRGRPRHHDQDVPAAGHRTPRSSPKPCCRRRSRADMRRSSWSRMTGWCATMC